MGTPEFALASLEALRESPWKVVGVVTQPDRPRGRGGQILPSAVKESAGRNSLPLYQPERVRDTDFLEEIRRIAPDVIVVVAFGQILPKSLLAIPKRGCINLHASLLPKYRGAAPIQWALIKGERETGITTILMNEAMDEGDILLQESVGIQENETAGELTRRLARKGARLLTKTLEALESGHLTPQPQDHQEASYAPSLKKEDGEIHWQQTAEQIRNLIRGTEPWPGAYTFLGSERLRIWRARVQKRDFHPGTPGLILSPSPEGLEVVTGQGILKIEELQPANKKRMSVKEFLPGHPVKEGMVLGVPDKKGSPES